MYAQLKAIMKSRGYQVSEGNVWTGSDTEQFVAFAKYVLGAQYISPNQLLGYPQAFPQFVAAMQALQTSLTDEDEAPTPEQSASVAEPASEPEPAPVPEIETPTPAPTQTPDDVMDVSGGEGSGEPPAQPEVQDAPSQDTPAPEDNTDSDDTEEA